MSLRTNSKKLPVQEKVKTQRCIMQDTMINVPIEVLPLLGISNICFNSKQPHFTGFHYSIV